MQRSYWFGVDVSFLCPSCNRKSIEKLAVSAFDPRDYDSVTRAINTEKLVCQNCRKPLARLHRVTTHIHPGTPEQLKQWEYPIPRYCLSVV